MRERRSGAGWIVLTIIAIIVLIIAGWQLYKILHEYQVGDDLYEEVQADVVDGYINDNINSDDLIQTSNFDDMTDLQRAIPDGYDIPDIDWNDANYENLIGWIYVPGTNINYPVCQASDNDYYLTHLVDGTYNANGTIFMDCVNDPNLTDDNTILYGHHMRSGKMFQNLVYWKNQSFYYNHPYGFYLTEEQNYRLDFFSGYETNPGSRAYMILFAERDSFIDWLSEIREKSAFRPFGVGLSETDHVMTLSTCDYDWNDARFVLHGKMVPID